MVKRLAVPPLRTFGCTQSASVERKRCALGRFPPRLRPGQCADASRARDRLAFRPKTEAEMVACSQPSSGDQRAMPVSKFVSFACRLRRCRCGEGAQARFQKRADRADDRHAGGSVSPAVWRDDSRSTGLVGVVTDWFRAATDMDESFARIGANTWLVALDMDRSGSFCDRALRDSHFPGCGRRRR